MGNISKHAVNSTGWMTAQEFWPSLYMQTMREASLIREDNDHKTGLEKATECGPLSASFLH